MTSTQVFLSATLPLIVSMFIAVLGLAHHFDKRLDDMREFIRSEIKRLEDRIERIEGRLEHPILRS